MPDLFELKKKKELFDKLQQELLDYESSNEFKFINEIEALIKKYDYTNSDVVRLLGGKFKGAQGNRNDRVMKIYVHPDDASDRVETKGGNHKRLREWRDDLLKTEKAKTKDEAKEIINGWRIDKHK